MDTTLLQKRLRECEEAKKVAHYAFLEAENNFLKAQLQNKETVQSHVNAPTFAPNISPNVAPSITPTVAPNTVPVVLPTAPSQAPLVLAPTQPVQSKQCTQCKKIKALSFFPEKTKKLCVDCTKKRRGNYLQLKEKNNVLKEQNSMLRCCGHCGRTSSIHYFIKWKNTLVDPSCVDESSDLPFEEWLNWPFKATTGSCIQCLTKQKYKKITPVALQLKQIYTKWRKDHACHDCGLRDWRCIQADHDLGFKTNNLSNYNYFAKQKCPKEMYVKELSRCTPRCRMCHMIFTHATREAHVTSQKKLSSTTANVNRRQLRANLQMYSWQLKLDQHCEICNLKCTWDNKTGFEFDHLPAFTKSYNIGSMAHRLSNYDSGRKLIDTEVKKCRLLCGNCHHTFTHYFKDKTENAPVYMRADVNENTNLLLHPFDNAHKMTSLVASSEANLKAHAELQNKPPIVTEVQEPQQKKRRVESDKPIFRKSLAEWALETANSDDYGWSVDFPNMWIFKDDEWKCPFVYMNKYKHPRHFTLEDQNIEQPAQGTAEWHAQRGMKITGSKLTAFIYPKEADTPEQSRILHHDITFKKIKEVMDEDALNYCQWGTVYEDLALLNFLHFNKNFVTMEAPFVPHPVHDYLGASPDGIYRELDDNGNIIGEGVIEIKCPASKKQTPSAPIFYYVGQMHLEMASTGMKDCIFITWCPTNVKAWRVKWSPDVWKYLCILIEDLRLGRESPMTQKEFAICQAKYKKACEQCRKDAIKFHNRGGWKLDHGRPLEMSSKVNGTFNRVF